ncbi:MAG: ATP-binding protein [Burkholderiaceae bacterium]|nr:ATP-binding protein [Burkholderiaceae bacterium]
MWCTSVTLAGWSGHALADNGNAAGSMSSGLGFAMGLGFVLLALMVVVTLHRRAERCRQEAAELRQRQAQGEALGRLLDVWQWRTDRRHRLVSLIPPAGVVAPPSLVPQNADPQPVWTLFTGTDPDTGAPRTGGHAALRQRLESQQPAEDVLIAFRPADGGARLGQLRALPLHDARGAFIGHVGTVREQPGAASSATPVPTSATAASSVDIDHVLAMPSLTPLAIPAEQDAESFSYTVSHDLRAPIRVVEGFTKIVKEDYGRLLDRVGNDHLDRVLGAAARMNSMIDALLALSQLTAKPVSRQPVNLSQLAGFVIDDLRRQWPQHAVTVRIDPGMQVHGDPTLLRVVLENLLGNAWKYTGKCASPQVWFERCTDTMTPSFTVRDNGAGFDMRFADRLFGVFQRLHSATEFQGTGVGLASVRRIVHKHGGEVWAESEVGKGASFHFSLGNPSL